MDNVFVYGQEHCPKCDQLKSFLEDLGVPFTTMDMSDSYDYLNAWDVFPPDAGAPMLEVRDPIRYEAPNFYNHHELFSQGKLDTGLVETILGIKLVTEWE